MNIESKKLLNGIYGLLYIDEAEEDKPAFANYIRALIDEIKVMKTQSKAEDLIKNEIIYVMEEKIAG